MGEAATFAPILTHPGTVKEIQEQVRFTCARFGHDDLIDVVTVLIDFAVSGEPALVAFSEWLSLCAEPFLALFSRPLLPHRSTLSCFLAALDQSSVEALRTRFQTALLARHPFPGPGVFDRTGTLWFVIDMDEIRQAACHPALPPTESLSPPHHRFDLVCAPGYRRRKRGEAVRLVEKML